MMPYAPLPERPRRQRIEALDRRLIWEWVPDTPDTPLDALAQEALLLWSDLDRVLDDDSDYGARPWSARAHSTAGRVLRIERARGRATSWRHIGCYLLAYGIYQHLVEHAGLTHDQVDMTAVHDLWDTIHRGTPDPALWPGPGAFRLAP